MSGGQKLKANNGTYKFFLAQYCRQNKFPMEQYERIQFDTNSVDASLVLFVNV